LRVAFATATATVAAASSLNNAAEHCLLQSGEAAAAAAVEAASFTPPKNTGHKNCSSARAAQPFYGCPFCPAFLIFFLLMLFVKRYTDFSNIQSRKENYLKFLNNHYYVN